MPPDIRFRRFGYGTGNRSAKNTVPRSTDTGSVRSTVLVSPEVVKLRVASANTLKSAGECARILNPSAPGTMSVNV